LRSLTAELVLVEEDERRKIAEALHDSIGPLLAFSERELGNLQRFAPKEIALSLDEVKHHINDAVKQTRSLTFDLSPSSLYDLGFETAIEELAEQFAQERKLKFAFQNSDEPKPLTEESKVLLYRSVRELLVNIAKHADAKTVSVNLATLDSDIEITIKDNGKGFDIKKLDAKSAKSRGFGLFSIRERLTHIGGRFDIESKKGKGTKVTLLAPLDLEKK
jgi:signal transduction histidine kinase